MAWLAMLPFKMTALCFPFECVKVNKTSAASIYDAEGGIRLVLHVLEETGGTQPRRTLAPTFICVLPSLLLIFSPSSLSLPPRAHDVYQDAPWSY